MSATPTPRTEEVLRKNAASEQTPQEDYEALAVHAEMLERELSAERALADRLAGELRWRVEAGGHGAEQGKQALAAWKEARREP